MADEEATFWAELHRLGEAEVRRRIAANRYAASHPAYNQMARAFLEQERLRIEREQQSEQIAETRKATRTARFAMATSAVGVAISLAALVKGYLP